MSITFSINRYDNDGSIFEEGIFLNINDKLIIKVKDIEEIKGMISNLSLVIDEIGLNYSEYEG